MFPSLFTAMNFVKSGKLKAMGVAGAKRSELLPDVPTLAETVMPGFEVGAWQGLTVPAKTPPEIVRRLHAELGKALAAPDVRAKLAQQGADPLGSTPEAYGRYIKSEIERWTKVVRQTGASLE